MSQSQSLPLKNPWKKHSARDQIKARSFVACSYADHTPEHREIDVSVFSTTYSPHWSYKFFEIRYFWRIYLFGCNFTNFAARYFCVGPLAFVPSFSQTRLWCVPE